MQNKRGQGLSTNAIILIILGIIVLVVLILGFIMGWDKIAPWIKPTNNVDEIAQACQVACSTSSVYDFCSIKRELKTESNTLKDVTCFYLAEKQTSYGIQKCAPISCDVILDEGECPNNLGKSKQIFDEATKILEHGICLVTP